MKSMWWKFLCIVLLFWSVTAGFLVPLKDGVVGVSPNNFKTGETVELKVEGYNTQWKNNSELKAWLHIDSAFKVANGGKFIDTFIAYPIASIKTEVVSENLANFTFVVPKYLPTNSKIEQASLFVKNGEKGNSIRPSAVTISQDSINISEGKLAWSSQIINTNKWRFAFPYRNILYETVRNTFFHVPMWFVMFTLFGCGIVYSIRFLRTRNNIWDIKAQSYTLLGVVFGFLGLFTGAFWANYTWGEPFPMDIKIITTYVALAIYLAYFVLRVSFTDAEQRARISAVYSIFAFASLVPLLYIVPKLAPDSLHPGNGSSPAFGSQDLDNTLRMVFYPASIGWILLGIWIATLLVRVNIIKNKLANSAL